MLLPNKQLLPCAQSPISSFDQCTEWSVEEIVKRSIYFKGSLGLVIETKRSFLAEWITFIAQEKSRKHRIPTACINLDIKVTTVYEESPYLAWLFQRGT